MSHVAAVGVTELRYSARAGLLPELSRQTYDTLHKALREVTLNALDAGAELVTLDFSSIGSEGTLLVTDDGSGMTADDVQSSFLALGGSAKFGDDTKFGRIGIGSLALLHYGKSAVVETKVAGTDSITRVELRHPWSLSGPERSQRLDDLVAGDLTSVRYVGPRRDHFTRITLCGVSDDVVVECVDIARFYALVDKLRKALPLAWSDGSLRKALGAANPAVWADLEQHIAAYSGVVEVRSAWGSLTALDRRVYGEEAAEQWEGEPALIYKRLPVADTGREIVVGGYMLSQSHTSPAWAGLTARVQNVAVEERTFFEVESDPGFRKYLTGEVFIYGEIDRARLINIDRASFNRESPDYQVAQRYLAEQIVRFKAGRIQQPRRAKAVLKRRAQGVAALLVAVRSACEAAGIPNDPAFQNLSSGTRTRKLRIVAFDEAVSASVETCADLARDACDVRISPATGETLVKIGSWLEQPVVELAGSSYRVRLVEAGRIQPVIVRARPREILINLEHPALRSRAPEAVQIATILELGYLTIDRSSAEDLYDRVLEIASSLTDGR